VCPVKIHAQRLTAKERSSTLPTTTMRDLPDAASALAVRFIEKVSRNKDHQVVTYQWRQS
jgi:hypothetical protein